MNRVLAVCSLLAIIIPITALAQEFDIPLEASNAEGSVENTEALKIPFGGIILKSVPCNDGSLLLTVGPPWGGEYMLTPVSLKFAWYAFIPPEWILGMAAPGALVCTLGTTVMGAGLPIIMAGTSLTPGL